MKRICVLGSSGSMGTQTLDVLSNVADQFRVTGLSVNKNISLLLKQIGQFNPPAVCVVDTQQAKEIARKVDIPVFSGRAGISQLIESIDHDLVVNNIVGSRGLLPTLQAIQSGKDVALANKEAIVMAGELVMQSAREYGVQILPIDSEHSAVFQCLNGLETNEVQRLILTCSGGPFLGKTADQLRGVSVQQALEHPTWRMGKKITVDSATLMNKGLEVIEARWLFNTPGEAIDVVIHPEAIIHSMVEFRDGSIQSQMAEPDARLPIQVALGYPRRLDRIIKRFDFNRALTFAEPDTRTFRCLRLAYQALEVGGTMPCVLNAANEIAVRKFLAGKIPFLEIPDFIEGVMHNHRPIDNPTLDELVQVNDETLGELTDGENYSVD